MDIVREECVCNVYSAVKSKHAWHCDSVHFLQPDLQASQEGLFNKIRLLALMEVSPITVYKYRLM